MYSAVPFVADKVKFNFLMQKAIAYEADYIATGHYAQISTIDSEFALLKGVDESKDQSYVLHTLKQNQLQNLILIKQKLLDLE